MRLGCTNYNTVGAGGRLYTTLHLTPITSCYLSPFNYICTYHHVPFPILLQLNHSAIFAVPLSPRTCLTHGAVDPHTAANPCHFRCYPGSADNRHEVHDWCTLATGGGASVERGTPPVGWSASRLDAGRGARTLASRVNIRF